jgi:hypothetical protein
MFIVLVAHATWQPETFGLFTTLESARKDADERLARCGAYGTWYTDTQYEGKCGPLTLRVWINQHNVIR